MARSYLQEPFMREVAATFMATQARIARRLAADRALDTASVIEDELRGLYHGIFVILDGGTALADEGLVRISDDQGVQFDRFLHEGCFAFWPKDSPATPG